MKTIGFVRSHKENEHRIALLPPDIEGLKHPENIYIETGYGLELQIADEEFARMGANIVSREEALAKDIVCDPKIGDSEYIAQLKDQTLFGWVHAVQNKEISDAIVNNGNTAIAWEDMYHDGRHVFWRNNEIAGEAAIMHAYLLHGVFPYRTRVAVLGRGNVARGAMKTLHFLGADVTTYDRRTEHLFRQELSQYDVIVNGILWDTSRQDHIIYREDLKRMKKGALIIDISCDRNGGVETSIPTTIEEPIYEIEGIAHYVVDHTPSLFFKTTSEDISKQVAQYLDHLIEDRAQENTVLRKATVIKEGEIMDGRITEFQNRNQRPESPIKLGGG